MDTDVVCQRLCSTCTANTLIRKFMKSLEHSIRTNNSHLRNGEILIEGKIEGRISMMGRQERRRKQLLDDRKGKEVIVN